MRPTAALLALAMGCNKEPGLCEAPLEVAVDGVVLAVESEGCASATLEGAALGEGALELTLEVTDGVVVPRVRGGPGGGVLEAVSLSGPVSLAGAATPRLWKQGYQSWWWSGVTELRAMELDDRGLPVVGGDGGGADAVSETAWSSWWVGLLGRPDGASLLLGALSATRTKTWAAFGEDEAWFVWGGRGERIALDQGDEVVLDPLWVGAGADAFALHRAYAQAALDARGLPAARGLPPVGWATWTVTYEHVTQGDVLQALDDADALRARGLDGLELIQLDDGWAVAWGDWRANERFDMGMDALAAQIAGRGYQPGLWMAPFYVEADSDVYRDHPGWWVRGFDGEELSYSNFGDHDYRVVDVTHPEAAAWLRQQIATRVAEGWTYLKLDFLYAGAQEGLRHEDVTGSEALAIGLDLLREGAGDAWILACGAPMLPSLGFADSYRTGADIAFNFDPDPRREYLRWQARATAGRSWQNGLWWWVDPDQFMLRAPFSGVEGTGVVAAQVASGGAWLLGDALGALSEAQAELALNPELLALVGAVGQPDQPLDWPSGPDFGPVAERAFPDDVAPPRWTLDSGHVVLLNLGDDPVTVEGPGGRELFSGEQAPAGERTLAPGAGEVWWP